MFRVQYFTDVTRECGEEETYYPRDQIDYLRN